MKKILLIASFWVLSVALHAQSIQLPGTGSNQVSVASSLISPSAHFVFGNPEYQVVGFTIGFLTNTNINYSASSTNDHFTEDMITHLSQVAAGSDINLQITLKAPGEGHEAWFKNYILHIN